MRWHVHGERSLYDSEWVAPQPGRRRAAERAALRAPRRADAGVGGRRRRHRSRPRRRAAAVAPPLHDRHVGLGDPGRPRRRRRVTDRGRPARDARGDRLAPGSAAPARRATSRTTGSPTARSTSSPPTAPSTSATRSTPTRPSGWRGSRGPTCGSAIDAGQVGDGLSLTALLWVLAHSMLSTHVTVGSVQALGFIALSDRSVHSQRVFARRGLARPPRIGHHGPSRGGLLPFRRPRRVNTGPARAIDSTQGEECVSTTDDRWRLPR